MEGRIIIVASLLVGCLFAPSFGAAQVLPAESLPQETTSDEPPPQEAEKPETQREHREEAVEADKEEKEEDEELVPPLRIEEEEKERIREEEEVAAGRTVTLDAAITMNYLFEGSSDGFLIKYSFHIEGKANADTAILKGDAELRSQVEGSLAKWPTGECKLDVTIPKIPYELIYKKTAEDKVSINMQFKGTILETWQSECSFAGATKKFTTTGNPEKWLGEALSKARPPLNSIALKFDEREITSTTFTITKQILRDPPLGTAEVEGTGVVTISPTN